MSIDRDRRSIPTLSRRERPMLGATVFSSLVLRTQPDDRLATLAADGSEAAFEAIVQRYRRDLLAYCSRLLLSDSRAEGCGAAGAAVRMDRAAWRHGGRAPQALAVPDHSQPGDQHAAPTGLGLRRALGVALGTRRPGRRSRAADAHARDARCGGGAAQRAAACDPADRRGGRLLRGGRQRDGCHRYGGARPRPSRARQPAAAVAAIAPPPLVLWAAGIERRHSGAVAWLSTALSSGGGAGATVGAGAVVIKSAAVLASSAALVGGTAAEHDTSVGQHHRAVHRGVASGRRAPGAGEGKAPLVASSASTGPPAVESRPGPRHGAGYAAGGTTVVRSARQPGTVTRTPARSASVPVSAPVVDAKGSRPAQPGGTGTVSRTGGQRPTEAPRETAPTPSSPASSGSVSAGRTSSAASAPASSNARPATPASTGSSTGPTPASAGQASPPGASAVASTSTDMRGSMSADTSTMVNSGATSPSASLNERPTSS